MVPEKLVKENRMVSEDEIARFVKFTSRYSSILDYGKDICSLGDKLLKWIPEKLDIKMLYTLERYNKEVIKILESEYHYNINSLNEQKFIFYDYLGNVLSELFKRTTDFNKDYDIASHAYNAYKAAAESLKTFDINKSIELYRKASLYAEDIAEILVLNNGNIDNIRKLMDEAYNNRRDIINIINNNLSTNSSFLSETNLDIIKYLDELIITGERKGDIFHDVESYKNVIDDSKTILTKISNIISNIDIFGYISIYSKLGKVGEKIFIETKNLGWGKGAYEYYKKSLSILLEKTNSNNYNNKIVESDNKIIESILNNIIHLTMLELEHIKKNRDNIFNSNTNNNISEENKKIIDRLYENEINIYNQISFIIKLTENKLKQFYKTQPLIAHLYELRGNTGIDLIDFSSGYRFKTNSKLNNKRQLIHNIMDDKTTAGYYWFKFDRLRSAIQYYDAGLFSYHCWLNMKTEELRYSTFKFLELFIKRSNLLESRIKKFQYEKESYYESDYIEEFSEKVNNAKNILSYITPKKS